MDDTWIHWTCRNSHSGWAVLERPVEVVAGFDWHLDPYQCSAMKGEKSAGAEECYDADGMVLDYY